jgi:sugar phosphate isomerase/epimerase
VLEGIGPWMDGPDAVAAGEVDENFELASTFGAEIVLASVQSPTLDLTRATEGFAALCERAAARGMRPALEFIPCRVVPDLATAWEIVRGSGAENGGILIDCMHWHYQPGGPDFDLLRRIPGKHIPFVQVCDAPPGPAPAPEEYIHRAVTARALPGEGVVDIDRIVATLAASGAEPYVAYEVFNLELAKQGPDVMAQRLREVADTRFG